MRNLAVVAITASLLVTACGGMQHTTTTVAQSSNPNKGRDYPASFEDGFISTCIEANTRKTCVCMLAYIETHVTHATVVQEIQQSRFVPSPGYQLALHTCHGHTT